MLDSGDTMVLDLMFDHPLRDSKSQCQIFDIIFVQHTLMQMLSQAIRRSKEFCGECAASLLAIRAGTCQKGI